MVNKEAKARIKINRLLEEAGWRFEDTNTSMGSEQNLFWSEK